MQKSISKKNKPTLIIGNTKKLSRVHFHHPIHSKLELEHQSNCLVTEKWRKLKWINENVTTPHFLWFFFMRSYKVSISRFQKNKSEVFSLKSTRYKPARSSFTWEISSSTACFSSRLPRVGAEIHHCSENRSLLRPLTCNIFEIPAAHDEQSELMTTKA